jgi:Domain of unknown function (DUF3331)
MSNAVWRHTLDLLFSALRHESKVAGKVGSCCRPHLAVAGANAPRSGNRPKDSCSAAKLEILERSSPTSLVVCWCDPTLGRYGDQPWRVGIAKGVSTCALTGERIKRGDRVFKPFGRGQKPANANQSILASALERSGSAGRVDAGTRDGAAFLDGHVGTQVGR